ncbi:LEA type 2 family protein [Motiliproteus sp. SC1-56]|uniref:LEA type 2 family protein n=1 Tax=Motiliproteus sp. SC1-56 TaxID=2799565 RepID=UPI001A8C28BD|nr:LEA type 2 family protein [Motiliproteus sp. SC1-56]
MRRRFWILWACLLVLHGCAGITPMMDPPQVSVIGLRALPGEGLAPRFEIALRISNPNSQALELEGLAYSITLAERKLLSGVSNELPRIEGYTTAEVKLEASVDLLQGVRLLSDLMAEPRDRFDYLLELRLDPGALSPDIRVTDRGSLSLRPK